MYHGIMNAEIQHLPNVTRSPYFIPSVSEISRTTEIHRIRHSIQIKMPFLFHSVVQLHKKMLFFFWKIALLQLQNKGNEISDSQNRQ